MLLLRVKRMTYLTAPDVPSTLGLMTFPAASLAFAILKVARVVAIDTKTCA